MTYQFNNLFDSTITSVKSVYRKNILTEASKSKLKNTPRSVTRYSTNCTNYVHTELMFMLTPQRLGVFTQ